MRYARLTCCLALTGTMLGVALEAIAQVSKTASENDGKSKPALVPAKDAADPGSSAKVTVKRDLVYGRVQGAGLLADIAYPEGKGPFPVILSVHGGRWVGSIEDRPRRRGHRRRAVGRFGFFAMSIDYRLVGCTPPPACYQDVLCAIRWVHAHADEYPIDRERIFLIGMSAGGHLVSLAATLGDGAVPAHGRMGQAAHRHPRGHQPVGTLRPGEAVVGHALEAGGGRSAGRAAAGLAHPSRRRDDKADADPALRQRRLGAGAASHRHGRRRWKKPRPRTACRSTRSKGTCASPTT